MFTYSGAKISKNTGAAFGLLNEASYLGILILAILVTLIFFMLSEKNIFPMGLIIGGGISNLIDRMVRGYIIDYLFLDPLPIFNLADLAVVIGVFLIVYGYRSNKISNF